MKPFADIVYVVGGQGWVLQHIDIIDYWYVWRD